MVTFEQMQRAMEARFAAREAREAAERTRLEGLLPRVAEGLRGRGATRVWVFGSLAEGRFREDSDVDLAVEGLPEGEVLRAAAWCADVLDRHVDLVPMEDAGPSLRERVLEVGRELR